MRRRTRARAIAVQFLYQLDIRGEEAMAQLPEFLASETQDRETQLFARRLIEGAWRAVERSDATLRAVARNWDLERMAVVDRNILRMAIFELLECPDIPPKVTINEAIELGKKYSTANSGAFINGILDRVRVDHLEASSSAGGSEHPEAGPESASAAG
jgi:transcription antitermination factor NusB